jgi:thymidylate synthase (FAD)
MFGFAPNASKRGLMTPFVELLAYTQINPDLDTDKFPLYDVQDLIEYSGRWDYGPKSLTKMGNRDIIQRWIQSGEESMVEMGHAVFFIQCSRVVSHELVRHRLASFQQESQRYVDYTAETPEELFADIDDPLAMETYAKALETYNELVGSGTKKQIARYVLPNATRARMVMGTNFREWRHILKLRMHKSAQPEIQVIAEGIHDKLLAKFPEAFEDIKPYLEAGERAAR